MKKTWLSVFAVSAMSAVVACSLRGERFPVGGISQISRLGPTPDAAATANLTESPEPANGYRSGLVPVYAKTYMVATANPQATAAGRDVLREGGSAADAAVAVQAVLGLTVPEATGMGGGGFILYYDAATKVLQAYDGRETAPAAATQDYLRWVSPSDRSRPLPGVRESGRSIGTPGVPRLLEKLHKDHGKLAWRFLFDDGIRLASEGFPISKRLADAIRENRLHLNLDAEAKAYFLYANGTPKTEGVTLTNPAYARVLRQMANRGADVFYAGQIASDIVRKIRVTKGADAARTAITPGLTSLDDLSNYTVQVRNPVCVGYRMSYKVCGVPPPAGGLIVATIFGILNNIPLASYKPEQIGLEGARPAPMAVHLISEAERLAYADRDKYQADPDFVLPPGGSWDAMISNSYLRERAALINPNRSIGTAVAGNLPGWEVSAVDDQTEEHGTNQFTIVDAFGNVVSATTTVESSMGSFHMTNGFLLNNQLTDFSIEPVDSRGAIYANRVEAKKRPRSAMAPTIVFALPENVPLVATGSPGGGIIPQYVVKTVVGLLDWQLDAQQSANLINFGAMNSPKTYVGAEHPWVDTTNGSATDSLLKGLTALGHTVDVSPRVSGINTIVLSAEANGTSLLEGGTDPRREGVVSGDLRWKPKVRPGVGAGREASL